MTLVISDKDGVLGHIRQEDGKLTGSTPVMQRLADQYAERHGPDAYAWLADLDNGYVRASESPG